jgi:hypothetical protein
MALAFYSDASLVTEINTLASQHANTGASATAQIIIANKDATKTYEDVVVSVLDTSGSSETSWIQLALDNAGSPGTFGTAGASLTLADITSANTAYKFWVRITNAPSADSSKKTDLQLKFDAVEFAV